MKFTGLLTPCMGVKLKNPSYFLQKFSGLGAWISLTLIASCSLKCLVIFGYEFSNFNFNLWDHRGHMLGVFVLQRKFAFAPAGLQVYYFHEITLILLKKLNIKQMKRYLVFMVWKNYFCLNVHFPKVIYRFDTIPI